MNSSGAGGGGGFGSELLDVLARLGEIDGEEDTTEAEAAGCRKVAAVGERWGLFRVWDEPGEGDPPVAIFTERAVALLASAVWVAQARAPLLRLDLISTAEGFRIWPACEMAEGATHRPIGWFSSFNQPAAVALDLAAALVRDPEALAALLEAAGVEAVEQVVRILRRRLRDRSADPSTAG